MANNITQLQAELGSAKIRFTGFVDKIRESNTVIRTLESQIVSLNKQIADNPNWKFSKEKELINQRNGKVTLLATANSKRNSLIAQRVLVEVEISDLELRIKAFETALNLSLASGQTLSEATKSANEGIETPEEKRKKAIAIGASIAGFVLLVILSIIVRKMILKRKSKKKK